MTKELLLKIKKYIERSEETIDGEWGSCREYPQLIEDKAMPSIYTLVLEQLALYEQDL